MGGVSVVEFVLAPGEELLVVDDGTLVVTGADDAGLVIGGDGKDTFRPLMAVTVLSAHTFIPTGVAASWVRFRAMPTLP